jgi:hypothetical protein
VGGVKNHVITAEDHHDLEHRHIEKCLLNGFDCRYCEQAKDRCLELGCESCCTME